MKPYYEGWYLKQQQGDTVFAVIPGRAQDHAFIQVVTPAVSHFVRYPLTAFAREGSCMRVGGSLFTPRGMALNVHEPGVDLDGWFRFGSITPLRYDIMGPFSLLPMETKHTVLSMRHRVEGEALLNGRLLRFDDGVGYAEGDRGHSFPRSYTWLQSADFNAEASVMLAIAHIPLGPIQFTGCIGVVSLEGREHRFATYLGSHILEADGTRMKVAQGGKLLEVEVPRSQGRQLQAPVAGDMERPIRESIDVPARIRFSQHGRTLLENPAARTSFELVPAER